MKRFVCLCLGLSIACSRGEDLRNSQSSAPPNTTTPRYATDFARTESPISEGGRWSNGGTDAGDWTDVSTTPGHAIGHQVGASYTDATAILKGTWSPNQSATATVFTTEPLSDLCLSEVELRLRSSIGPHDNRGYEVTFKVSETEKAYLLIVRWNGVLGDFTELLKATGAQYGVKNGDIMKATIVGNRITAYKNGVMMGQVSDGAFATGNPGMGFNLYNSLARCLGTNDKYGFSSFSVTDSVDR